MIGLVLWVLLIAGLVIYLTDGEHWLPSAVYIVALAVLGAMLMVEMFS